MIDPDDTGEFARDVARRLRLTRAALKMNQDEFAEPAGLSQPQYSQYESGKEDRPLTLRAALPLCEAHNLTLDWLFRGDPSGLPVRLHDAIKAARLLKKTTRRGARHSD
jgi:transcriptional regulator with XRE-family HTH domain